MQSQGTNVVVVGAGHNGLVAAAYLARAGCPVTILEARDVVGGACVTEELIPGFRFSSAAVVLSLLWPKIVRDLELRRFGLEYFRTGVDRVGLWENGRALILYPELDRQLAAISGFSRKDARGLVRLGVDLRRYAALVEPTLLRPPLPVERMRACFTGRDVPLWERFVTGSIAQLLEHYFESPELLGFFAFPGLVSVAAGPDTPGTAYVFSHHALGGLDGELGAHGYVRGGMGGVTRALAASAEAAGARIVTGVRVERIDVIDGATVGVTLADGTELPATAVVSNADAQRTLLRLVDKAHLPTDVAEAAAAIDYGGSMARVYLALRELPRYEAAPYRGSDPADVHSAFTLLGAGIDAFRRAHETQVRGELPRDPVLELTMQSVNDSSLAPAGMHTATLGVMHVPRELARGTWDERREELGDLIVERLASFAPNVPSAIVGRRVATPLDLERTFGLTGGNIFQGAMTPAQLFGSRPLPGWSNYRLPIQGLYLCGSGSHPGGAVSGGPGHNAAHEVLADLAHGPLAREAWLARARRENDLPRHSKRGRVLRTIAEAPSGSSLLVAVAKRPSARPLIRRLTTTR